MTTRTVLFETAEHELTLDNHVILDDIVNILRLNPDLTISLEGHTDSVGTSPDNMTLSENRVNSVADYLIAEGIAAGRITRAHFGEDRPIADNSTDAGKEQNRRVELTYAEPLTDAFPSLSIGSVAISPIDSNRVFAGIGKTSSDSGKGGPEIGILYSADGGDSWTLLGEETFSGLRITRVFPTSMTATGGQVVFVSTLDVDRNNDNVLDNRGGVFLGEVAVDGTTSTFVRISGNGTSGLPAGHYTDLAYDPGDVWYAYNDTNYSYEIYLYTTSGGVRKISDETSGGYYPRISDNGNVVWQGVDSVIYLYDASSGMTRTISSPSTSNNTPKINAHGSVVWSGYDYTNYNDEIYLYDASAGMTRNLSLSPYSYDYNPQISDNDNVGWYGWDENESEYVFFMYDAASGEIISVNIGSLSGEYDALDINARGDVVGAVNIYPYGDYEIYLYTGMDIPMPPHGGEASGNIDLAALSALDLTTLTDDQLGYLYYDLLAENRRVRQDLVNLSSDEAAILAQIQAQQGEIADIDQELIPLQQFINITGDELTNLQNEIDHRDRAVTALDYVSMTVGGPGIEINAASRNLSLYLDVLSVEMQGFVNSLLSEREYSLVEGDITQTNAQLNDVITAIEIIQNINIADYSSIDSGLRNLYDYRHLLVTELKQIVTDLSEGYYGDKPYYAVLDAYNILYSLSDPASGMDYYQYDNTLRMLFGYSNLLAAHLHGQHSLWTVLVMWDGIHPLHLIHPARRISAIMMQTPAILNTPPTRQVHGCLL